MRGLFICLFSSFSNSLSIPSIVSLSFPLLFLLSFKLVVDRSESLDVSFPHTLNFVWGNSWLVGIKTCLRRAIWVRVRMPRRRLRNVDRHSQILSFKTPPASTSKMDSVPHLHGYVHFYQTESIIAFATSASGVALVIDRATTRINLQGMLITTIEISS